MSNKISNENKIKNKRGRPKKQILEEFTIEENNKSSNESTPDAEPIKKYNNLEKARMIRKNKKLEYQNQKQSQVQDIIINMKKDELGKLDDKYNKLQNRMLKLIK